MPPFMLPILFIFVAALYAMAGFGGGSTYIALLAVSGLPLVGIPVIALVCNLIVSGQGSFILVRKGFAQATILIPLLLGSIPAAFLGGAWRLPESTFIGLLAIALSLAGLVMLLQDRLSKTNDEEVVKTPPMVILLVAGILLGLLAGITGIGGGIYLAPIMHLCKWARAQTIAACTSLFIALNSLSGLIGQLTKGLDFLDTLPWFVALCPLAVLVGGRVGTYFLANKLPQKHVRRLTAAVILLVAARLWLKILAG